MGLSCVALADPPYWYSDWIQSGPEADRYFELGWQRVDVHTGFKPVDRHHEDPLLHRFDSCEVGLKVGVSSGLRFRSRPASAPVLKLKIAKSLESGSSNRSLKEEIAKEAHGFLANFHVRDRLVLPLSENEKPTVSDQEREKFILENIVIRITWDLTEESLMEAHLYPAMADRMRFNHYYQQVAAELGIPIALVKRIAERMIERFWQ
jgi:hypothetical protein